MVDFRRWFTVLAVLALAAGAASAQVGFANGSASDLLACTATAAGTPELRPEGFTDLAGDIVISCTGGPVLAQGSVVPTTNIVVYMQPSVPITSRFMQSNGQSEVLLFIDDPGSGIKTGAVGNYGPNAPQTLCTSDQQQDNGGVNNGSSCTPYVGQTTAQDANGATIPNTYYSVAVTSVGGTTAAKNVYQGKIGDFGNNSVAFYNVPVLPPATSGVRRTFRITNIRVPGNPAYASGVTFLLNATISTSPSAALPISGTALNIGILGKASTANVTKLVTGFQQCNKQTTALSAVLTFTEGFATAFKTRVVPMTNTTWAAEQTNTTGGSYQNIPGGLYNNFAANSESGLIYPTLTASASSVGTYTAGLADFGTRLKAVFVNLPAGVSLYVSNHNMNSDGSALGNIPAPPGGTSVYPYAVLVATGSDATVDGTVKFTSGSSAAPIGTDPVPLVANGGIYTAVWEVTNSNPSAIDVMNFDVYISYTASAPTATNPYGTPITDLPPGAPVPTVFLTLAPEPAGSGTFPSGTTFSTPGTVIPRFANLPNSSGRYLTIGLCQTTLLYPWVTGAGGFDTGIAVANTSKDPWKTVGQSGSCDLYGYGTQDGATGATHWEPVISGCDSLTGATPAPGTNCFDRVPAGEVVTINAATAPAGAGPLVGFKGYVIAICRFQFAHGYAAISDVGLRFGFSSYLALELGACTPDSGTGTCVGSQKRALPGPTTIEQLVH